MRPPSTPLRSPPGGGGSAMRRGLNGRLKRQPQVRPAGPRPSFRAWRRAAPRPRRLDARDAPCCAAEPRRQRAVLRPGPCGPRCAAEPRSGPGAVLAGQRAAWKLVGRRLAGIGALVLNYLYFLGRSTISA